jgi:hypothetical protein
MADTHPFATAGLSQFGGDRNYSSGGSNNALGPFLAQYLAHKTGLIDLSDPTQKESIQKNGLQGHFLNKFMDKAVPPNILGKNSAFEGIPAGDNSVSAPINNTPGVAPTSPVQPVMPSAAQPPSSGNAGMDQQLSSFSEPPVDFHNFDTDIASYANMIDLGELGDFVSLAGLFA